MVNQDNRIDDNLEEEYKILEKKNMTIDCTFYKAIEKATSGFLKCKMYRLFPLKPHHKQKQFYT